MGQPLASLSLDLDNKWSYLRTHGSGRWREYPSYLEAVVPTILDVLDQHRLKITFFVVGRDAAKDGHSECLAAIAAAGHEIANHSFNHEPWIHLLSRDEIEREILTAMEAILKVTGKQTRGFRGPGYSISKTHLEVLATIGFEYDASAFPNILNPLARAYFFAKSDLSDEEKRQRRALFGNLSDAIRPIDPFVWTLPSGDLLEIPVTTMPLLRLPCHFSYILYLSGYSEWLASFYFKWALWLCRRTGTEPSLLLHPLDFLGREDESDLGFFPAMNLGRAHKFKVLDRCLDDLSRHFQVSTMAGYVDKTRPFAKNLKRFDPDFGKKHR